MPHDRYIRGSINAVLNGLVRDGVVCGFTTDFGPHKPASEKVQITVGAGSAMDHVSVHKTVTEALDRFADVLSVRVTAG